MSLKKKKKMMKNTSCSPVIAIENQNSADHANLLLLVIIPRLDSEVQMAN